MTAIVDRFLNLTISKKLTVFILATIFLYFEKLDSENWLNLAMVYIGTQGSVDFIKELRK